MRIRQDVRFPASVLEEQEIEQPRKQMRKTITITAIGSLFLALGVTAEARAAKRKAAPSHPLQPQVPSPQHHDVNNSHHEGSQHQHIANRGEHRTHDGKLNHQRDHFPANAHANNLRGVHSNRPATVQSGEWPATHAQPRTVQAIRAQHVNFHAQPSTHIAGSQFNQQHHIRGSEGWTGAHYEVFRTYRPEWHDRYWWHAHFPHIIFIGGGWYYWNGGYWYPAWGYDAAAAYYPYDGPIYVGPSARAADQVVADVQ